MSDNNKPTLEDVCKTVSIAMNYCKGKIDQDCDKCKYRYKCETGCLVSEFATQMLTGNYPEALSLFGEIRGRCEYG